MGITEQQQDLIDRYLQGRLDEASLDAFQETLKKSPEMKKALQAQEALAAGIEHYGNNKLRQRFQNISEEVKREKQINPDKRKKVIRFFMASAAAILILMVCFVFLFQKASPEKLFAQYYEPSQFSIARNDEGAEQIAQVEYLYNQQDYEAAIPIFEEILAQQAQNSEIRLTLGNAFLQTNRNAEAIQQFQQIIDKQDTLYMDQAKWYMALTFLKTNQVEKSTQLLSELADDPNADFHDLAKELLILVKK